MKDNKLIAEFMGVKPTILGDEITYEMYGIIDCIEDGLDEQHFFLEEELMFHTSWDWLMPVVEKIECTHDDKGDCFNVMMEAFECTISGLGLTLCLNGHTKMDATYKAVVEFIKEQNN